VLTRSDRVRAVDLGTDQAPCPPRRFHPARNSTVTQNEQQLCHGSRWVLYHGTSTARLKQILKDGCLRRAAVGDQKIALTTDRSFAEYFACNAVCADNDPRNQRLLPAIEIADSRCY